MCGRFAQKRKKAELATRFGCEAETTPEITENYNLSPTQDAAVVRFNPADGKRHLNLLRWGLIPGWSKDPSVGIKLTNARAESLTEKPSFKEAAFKRRCIIPADAFYEWRRTEKVKQPYAFAAPDAAPLALAGIWEGWRAPDGQIIRTFSVVTTAANEIMAPIHDRMPVIVGTKDLPLWLGETEGDWQALLRPCPANWLKCWPVSRRLNSGRESGPELLVPVDQDATSHPSESLPLGL
jgi:putative SOS response-associated peptidase YedK